MNMYKIWGSHQWNFEGEIWLLYLPKVDHITPKFSRLLGPIKSYQVMSYQASDLIFSYEFTMQLVITIIILYYAKRQQSSTNTHNKILG